MTWPSTSHTHPAIKKCIVALCSITLDTSNMK